LGQFLSNFYDCGEIITEDGPFRTIEGYWHWLSCGSDALREMEGWQAKDYAKDFPEDSFPPYPNMSIFEFKRKILTAIGIKIVSNQNACKLLVATKDLPLYHYYVYGGKVVEPKDCEWMVDFITQVRSDLIKGVLK
jgi:hypothetical protein